MIFLSLLFLFTIVKYICHITPHFLHPVNGMRVARHYVQSRIKHKVMQLFHAFLSLIRSRLKSSGFSRNNHIYKTGVRNKTSSEHKCICLWKFFFYIKEIFSCKYISVKTTLLLLFLLHNHTLQD